MQDFTTPSFKIKAEAKSFYTKQTVIDRLKVLENRGGKKSEREIKFLREILKKEFS